MERFPKPHHPGEAVTGHILTDQFDEYVTNFNLSDGDLKRSILDVGAANASFITHVREKLGNKNAYGIEFDSANIAPNTEGVVVGDGLHMQFKDGQFEIVLANAYVPMFYSERQSVAAVQEMLRVLAPGGVLKYASTSPEEELFHAAEFKNSGESEKAEEYEKTRYEDAKGLLDYVQSLDKLNYEVNKEISSTTTMRHPDGHLVTFPNTIVSIKKLRGPETSSLG